MIKEKKISIKFIAAITVILLGFILAVGYPGKDVMLEKVKTKKIEGQIIKQQKYIPKTSTVKKEKKKIVVTPPPSNTNADDDEGC